MKSLLTVLGMAAVGTMLVMRARGGKAKPLTFAGKTLMMAGRLAMLGLIGYRALRAGTKAVSDTVHETVQQAGKESVKAWNSQPSLSIHLK